MLITEDDDDVCFIFAGACLKSCTRCCVSCGRASGRWSARTKCLTPSGKWFHSSRVTRSKTLRNFSGKLVHTKYFLCFIRWHTEVGIILLSILDTHVILYVCAFALASDYRTILPVSQWCYSYMYVDDFEIMLPANFWTSYHPNLHRCRHYHLHLSIRRPVMRLPRRHHSSQPRHRCLRHRALAAAAAAAAWKAKIHPWIISSRTCLMGS